MRLAIVGTGLIGASAGLAAHRAGFASVAGWDEDPGVLEVAAERGAVTPAESLEAALARGGARLRRRSGCVGACGRPRRARARAGRLDGDRRGLDEGVGLPGGRRRSALRRRAPDLRSGGTRAGAREHRPLRGRDLVPHAAPDHRTCSLPCRARVRSRTRGEAAGDRPRNARPARRRDEPPPSRARERAPQPGGLLAHRWPRSAVRGGGLAARHDPCRGRQPADLGGHLPRQPGRSHARPRRAPPPRRAAREGARGRRRRLPRALDRRGEREPARDARHRVRGRGSAAPSPRARPRPARCARRDLPGTRRGASQRQRLRARAPLARTAAARSRSSSPASPRPPRPPASSRPRATASSRRPCSTSEPLRAPSSRWAPGGSPRTRRCRPRARA